MRGLEHSSEAKRSEVAELRLRRRWGADHIAHETGLAASIVQNILNGAGLGRLDRGERARVPRAPVRRYAVGLGPIGVVRRWAWCQRLER